MTWPDGIRARPAQPADLTAVAALIRAGEEQLGAAGGGEGVLAEEWGEADLPTGSIVLEAAQGIVGYGLLTVSSEEAFAAGHVHPDWTGRGLGTALLRELARRAEGRAPVLRAGCLTQDAAAAALLANEGMAFVRRFAWMEVRLGDEPPPAAAPPARTVLRPARPGEEREFHDVIVAAFTGSWGFHDDDFGAWLERVTVQQARDPALWLVAEQGGRLVGTLRGLPEHRGGGWIRSLAVLPAVRGQGIGRALLLQALAVFHARGERVVGLGVDTGNETGALALYESTGMAAREAVDVYERPLGSPGAFSLGTRHPPN